ncbi:Centrosomal protein of 76 kDa [Phytophthora pseudosyringae]|uniref:Centrosomal protein of 76 kDa n=1 Tax=Phytophthora pseudosyringae TaxID=221518 RepID=A0A8T1W1A8_9STRA|nr:Centrosomal protein of 76 kDa [Phytophthora pseudosyringae]
MDAQITDAEPVTETKADALSSDKIRSLRAAIDAKLHERGVYEQIRDLVFVNSKATSGVDDGGGERQPNSEEELVGEDAARAREEQLIHDVLESDVVQQLLAAVRSMELAAPGQEGAEKSSSHDDGEDGEDAVRFEDERDPFLYLRLSGGKAFVDQLVELEQDDQEADGGLDEKSCPVGSVVAFFRVNASFQKQRQSSRDVRCCVDPPFDEHFRFRVEKKRARTARTRGGASYAVDVASPSEALCLVEEPVQLDVVKVTKKLLSRAGDSHGQWRELSCELIAVHRLDWRRVLCSTLQLVHFPVQLTGRMKEPAGTLDIRADLLHWKRAASVARESRSFLSKEALQRNASNHSFYKYAKQWWDEYRSETREGKGQAPKGSTGAGSAAEDEYAQLLTQIGSRQRLVKMFAEDEEGRYRMVCKFVVPVRVPTAVRSPSEAARFVGLLPYESTSLVGGGTDETWRSIGTVLSLRKGDAQDHAVLLASLLLGCGLDAFVCIGTISASKSASRFARGSQRSYDDRGSTRSAEVGHVWVLTRGSSSGDVLLWEAVTGEKFAVTDARAPTRRGYCTIDCVFNHRQFFANLQPRVWKLVESSFDFDDETCWKRMDETLIADLPFAQPSVALLAPDVVSASMLQQEWTTALKRAISSRRRAEGLVTRWSEELSFYLLPALNSYELERLYGVTHVDNHFFQQSVTNFVQEGHTFQGVPSMFTVESPDEALASMTANPLVADILTLHARSAQLALAVRCFPYAEQTVATWIMLAVSYQSTS